MQSVPVRVSKETRKFLKKLKNYPRETYDDVLKRLIKIYKEGIK